MNKKYYLINFQQHGDERGMLVALEQTKEIPFQIKRVYYMFDTVPSCRRGYHSHRNLQQVLICVHGSCCIHVDDGHSSEEVVLDSPCVGLYLANNVWREMYNFSEGAVLISLASELYDENDYQRDYQSFIETVKNSKESQ